MFMKKLVRDIFEQFRLIDGFRDDFRNELASRFIPVLNSEYGISDEHQAMNLMYDIAEDSMNFVEAVIDKDRNYPEYRQKLELAAMDRLLKKVDFTMFDKREIQKMKYHLNEITLKYYPALYELTGFGYRLLDRIVSYYSYVFVSYIYEAKNKIQEQ